MSDSPTPAKAEQLPCPLSHLLLALIAVAPAVITVPANLNIVLTAAIAVWVGSKRSVKDTPPEESMTRTVRACLPFTRLAPFNYWFAHLQHTAVKDIPPGLIPDNPQLISLVTACLPGCVKVPSCGQCCPLWSFHYLQDSSQTPSQPCFGWLLCAAGSSCADSNTAALH